MSTYHYISSEKLDIVAIYNIFKDNKKLKLSKESIQKIKTCKTYLDKKLSEAEKPFYGINTGNNIC